MRIIAVFGLRMVEDSCDRFGRAFDIAITGTPVAKTDSHDATTIPGCSREECFSRVAIAAITSSVLRS
jgi:hypothetical protein